MTMENNVLNKIIELIYKETGIENITKDSTLFDDLEMSSLEVFSVFAELEESFSIHLSEKMIGGITTVSDIEKVVIKAINDGK